MTSSDETADDTAGTVHVLAEHHRALDERINALVARAQGGDPGQLAAAWTAFEGELTRHLELEEAEILPAFAAHDPGEARALLDEHAALRTALGEIGMTLDLHCLRTEAVADFVRKLKAHAHREDAALYAWAQVHVSSGTWGVIKRGLSQVARLGTGLSRVANSYM